MLTEEQIVDEIIKIKDFISKNEDSLESWNKLRLESILEAYRTVINDGKTIFEQFQKE